MSHVMGDGFSCPLEDLRASTHVLNVSDFRETNSNNTLPSMSPKWTCEDAVKKGTL